MIKKILLCIVILGVFCFTGCGKKEVKDSDASKFKEEYESYNGEKTSSGKGYLEVSIPSDNVIKYSSITELLDVIKNKSGVIYLGYPTCPWCRNAITPLLEAASSTSLDKIYYLNMYEVRDAISYENGEFVTTKEGSSDYYDLVEALNSILDDYIVKDSDGVEHNTSKKRIYVPLVVFVKDGEIVSYHADTVASQTDPYVKLTNEQHDELYDIYLDGIHKVLNDVCDERC